MIKSPLCCGEHELYDLGRFHLRINAHQQLFWEWAERGRDEGMARVISKLLITCWAWL